MAFDHAWPSTKGNEIVTGRISGELKAELARIEAPLAMAGFLIGEVHVVDEGSWGRLDALIEGTESSGKLQIHLGKKGRVSIVPQGCAALAIARVLADAGHETTAPNPARTRPGESSEPTRAAPLRRPKVAGKPGEFVVDCSKFGGALIGPTEWRGVVFTDSGDWREVFRSALYPKGHNNLGEFLAIVDACRRLERGEQKCAVLLSDSKTALSWFRNGKMKTTIDIDGACDRAFAAAVSDARDWLKAADRPKWCAMMARWDTSVRGENPADFGRK